MKENNMSEQNNQQCPSCHKINNPTAVFCEQCGNKLQEKPPHSCPSCNASLTPGAVYCTFCGHKTEQSQAESFPAPQSNISATTSTPNTRPQTTSFSKPQRKAKLPLIPTLVGAGIIIIAAIIFVIIGLKSSGKQITDKNVTKLIVDHKLKAPKGSFSYFSSDASLVAHKNVRLASIDIFDTNSGNKISTIAYTGELEEISGIYISPNNEYVAASDKSIIKIWQINKPDAPIHQLKIDDPESIRWSPDGKQIGVIEEDSNEVFLWHPFNGMTKNVATENEVDSFTWSENGKYILAYSYKSKLNQTLLIDPEKSILLKAPNQIKTPFRRAFFCDRGNKLLYENGYGLFLWEIGKDDVKSIGPKNGGYSFMSISPDTKHFLLRNSGTDNFIIWNIESDKAIATILFDKDFNYTNWSPNSKRVAFIDKENIYIYDTQNGEKLQSIYVGPNEIISITWNSDSSLLTTMDSDKIYFWSSKTGQLIHSFSKPEMGNISLLRWINEGTKLLFRSIETEVIWTLP